MKALSIKQPWASLVCLGLKDIENRSWKLPLEMEGERIYVHASLKPDRGSFEWLADRGFPIAPALMLQSNMMPTGAIIGEISLIRCVNHSESRWFSGPFGWMLDNPRLYDKPIPYKGQLRFFNVEIPTNKTLQRTATSATAEPGTK